MAAGHTSISTLFWFSLRHLVPASSSAARGSARCGFLQLSCHFHVASWCLCSTVAASWFLLLFYHNLKLYIRKIRKNRNVKFYYLCSTPVDYKANVEMSNLNLASLSNIGCFRVSVFSILPYSFCFVCNTVYVVHKYVLLCAGVWMI